MGGAIATHRDHESIAGRGRVVGGIAAPSGLDDLEGQPSARDGAVAPEAEGSPATRRRVDDHERRLLRGQVWLLPDGTARILLAFSTSRAICC